MLKFFLKDWPQLHTAATAVTVPALCKKIQQREIYFPLLITLITMDQQQLKAILNYHNDDVISRFTDQFKISEAEAEDIFTETKKFLYLCQLPGIFIPDELLIVDEMWHNFILFTKEYQQFCDRHFGRYFHHLPASKAEKENHKVEEAANPDRIREAFNQKLSIVISQAYDHLGPDTVIKWFNDYPVKYSKPIISSLRKY